MNLVVVIPAYNEEATVGAVVHQTLIHNSKFIIQTIVVDDGSQDKTAEVAREAGAAVVCHPINRGLGAALATGIEAALRIVNYESGIMNQGIVVTLDADGQHDPAEIARVIEPIVKGEAEVVIGSRFKIPDSRFQIPWHRRAANIAGNFFTWLLFGIWVSDSQSGFRAFAAKAAAKLNLRTSTMEVSSEIIREIARLRLKMVEVPVSVRYTSYTLSKGQGFLRGLETIWKLIVLKFFR